MEIAKRNHIERAKYIQESISATHKNGVQETIKIFSMFKICIDVATECRR
mgnify:CR=1 FL=1|jgi:hypothetical protein